MNAKKLRFDLLSLAFLLAHAAMMVVVAEEDGEDVTMAEKRRAAMSKKWYMQKLTIGDKRLPMSPVSIVVGFLSLYFLYSNWPGAKKSKVYCEASHILIMDHSKDTKEKLLEFQTKIQSDPELFAKLAKKHSACPSKGNGGNLGKFRPGDMAPPFDKLCFDAATPMKTTVGPVQTNFGWHLIYIHARQLSES